VRYWLRPGRTASTSSSTSASARVAASLLYGGLTMGYDADKYEVQDGIPWDDLQEIKNEVAGRDERAIEIYPAADELVNEANIRHLWVVPWDFPLPNLRR
jgi:hypothetical protein